MLPATRLVSATATLLLASFPVAAFSALTVTQFTASVEVVGSRGFPDVQQSTTTFGEMISVAASNPPPDIAEGSATTTTGWLGNGLFVESVNFARTVFSPDRSAFVAAESISEVRFSLSESTTLLLDGWVDTDFYLGRPAAGPTIQLYQEGSPALVHIDSLRVDGPISESFDVQAGDYVLFLRVYATSSFGGTGSAPGERTGGSRVEVTTVPAPSAAALLLSGGLPLILKRSRPGLRATSPARS